MNTYLRISLILAITLGAACGRDAAGAPGTPAASTASAPSAPAVPAEPALVGANAPAPAGITLARQSVAGLSLAVPTGGDWQATSMGMGKEFSSESTGITVMIQRQSGVPADARESYVASLVQANTRDAPHYRVVAQSTGTVAGEPAARVDGTFDNGTSFQTRDYVVFVNGSALAVMVRGGDGNLTTVQAIADAIASSVGS